MGGRTSGTWRPRGTIETPCGRMTRYHAQILSGLSRGTLIRRVWQGFPVECLFMPDLHGTEFQGQFKHSATPRKKTLGRGGKKGRAVSYSEKSLTMSWHEWREERRRAREQTSA